MSVYQNIVEKVYQCITNHKHQSSEHANEYVIASLLGFSYCYEALTFNNNYFKTNNKQTIEG